MAIKINFDTANNPELPTLILATRDGSKLGLLEAKQIELSEKLNGASEITFIVNKYVDGRLTNLWDKIVDFKLVYCQEWDVWFEIRVEIDEDTKTVKTVFGTQLAQAELSQLMLYNIEINTEADISRDDYKISVLYDPDNPDGSILHRIFDKAPHYSFGHIDGTLVGMQRSFSFDETSIYDALQEIAEEIGCLFKFHSGMTADGGIERYIEAWDLQQNCRNPECNHRGEFTGVCPKCGSTNVIDGYGTDTNIFITADELASNNIQFTTDTDSVKNCFKLEAGDDLMTATIRNCNPNGTDYIWYFSDSIKEDMSQDLKDRLTAYDALYLDYQKNHSFSLDEGLLIKYNNIVNKYKDINKDLENISSPITGYSQLMNAYYNVVDLSLYLESGMMPTVETSGTTAAQEAAKLTPTNLSPLAVTNLKYATRETVNSIAVGMAKVFVKPTYKVEINGTSTLSDYSNGATELTWQGSFTITNYSDEEDTFTTNAISLKVNDDAESFTKQKLEKALNNADTEDYSAVGLFKKSVHSSDTVVDNCSCDFCRELRKYALKPLSSFRDACQACIDILVEQGYTDASLYNSLYLPYWRKLKAIEKEMKVREEQIAAVDGVYDTDGNLLEEGLASKIEEIKESVQDDLDFESYLGDDLLIEFSSYRREDKYKNENYISDGLNNADLFERALEFIETAENEIFKSAELQHSISSSLKNLMAIKKFKSLVDYFEVGNWMRIQIDDVVYKLRLLEYTIDFDNLEDIPVVFSDVSKVRNGITDLEDIFSQASSMTTHYDAVKKQASKGQAAQGTIEQWLDKGLNSALVRINSNNSEEVSITQGGILCRSYDASTDSYSNEQLKLTHNIMAYTNDDWKTVKQAIGKHDYAVYDEKEDDVIYKTGYGMSAEFVTASYITGSTIIGGEIYSHNYKKKNSLGEPQGTYINLGTGAFSFGGDKIVYDNSKDTITLNNVTIKWSDGKEGNTGVNPPAASDIGDLEAYLNQLDGMIGTYSQTENPSDNWKTEAEKQEHIGDLWFNPTTGLTKRWNGSSWDTITDKDLEELAQSKAQIFTSQPTPPYYVGDLWVQGYTGDIKHCVKAKTISQSFEDSDWAKSSKYTNDDALTTFINDDYKTGLENINSQLDKKAETWYQAKDPSAAWNNDEKPHHVGDLWHCTAEIKSGDTVIRGKDSEWIWQNVNGVYQWCKMEVPDEVFDAIDGKSAIYTSEPPSQEVGDLLIPETAFSKDYGGTTYYFTAQKIYRCTEDSDSFRPDKWAEISYMSNDAFQDFLDNEYKDDLDAIKNQLDQKAQTWYQANDPSTAWNTTELKEEHIGDLWHNTKGTSDTDDDEDCVYTKINNNGVITYEWVKSSVEIPKKVYDLLDGKSAIYVKRPTTTADIAKLEEGDLLIPADDTDPPYKKGKVYRWTGSTWSEINYTDDTAANTAKGVADAAKAMGDRLNADLGIDFTTEIDGKYVISPVIGGGHLLIGDKSGVHAEITTEGKLIAQGAEINGSLKSGEKAIVGQEFRYNLDVTGGIVQMGYQAATDSYALTVNSDGQVILGEGVVLRWSELSGRPDIPSGGSGGGSSDGTDDLLRQEIGFTEINGQWVITPNIHGGYLCIGTKGSTQYAEITSGGILKAAGAQIYGSLHGGQKDTGDYFNFVADSTSVRACHMGNGNYNFVVDNDGAVKIGYQGSNKYAMTVGNDGKITFGDGVTLSWGSITGAPSGGSDSSGSEVTEQWVTNIAKNAITTDFLNARNIVAKSVSTDWVYAGNIAASQITAGKLQSANGNTYFDLANNEFASKGSNANWALKDGVMTFASSDDNWQSRVQISTDAMGMLWLTKIPKTNGVFNSLQAIALANGLAMHNYGSLKSDERNGSGYGVAETISAGYETSVIKFFTSLTNLTDYDTMIDRLMVRTQDVVCKTLKVGEAYETQQNLGIYRGTAQVCYSSSGNNTTLYSSSASDNDHTYKCYMKGSTTITFKKAFADGTTPTVVVSLIGTGDPLNHNILVSSRSNTSFTVNYKTTTDGAHPNFQWIAIGTPA